MASCVIEVLFCSINENMKRAVIYGSTMASFCVEEFSIARLKRLKQSEVNKRVKEFEKLTKFSM